MRRRAALLNNFFSTARVSKSRSAVTQMPFAGKFPARSGTILLSGDTQNLIIALFGNNTPEAMHLRSATLSDFFAAGKASAV